MTKEQIVKYFKNKFKNGKLTDKDRLFLVTILYGDLNLIEQLEYVLLEDENEMTYTLLEEIKKYIKS